MCQPKRQRPIPLSLWEKAMRCQRRKSWRRGWDPGTAALCESQRGCELLEGGPHRWLVSLALGRGPCGTNDVWVEGQMAKACRDCGQAPGACFPAHLPCAPAEPRFSRLQRAVC